jgi:uncharacterized protein (TIGR02302 family)
MTHKAPDQLLKRIETPLRLTLLGLWAERLSRAFWPLWSLSIALIAALSFGAQDHLPLETLWFAAVSATCALIWATVHGLRRFKKPTRTEALIRLDARLPGQPLAALRDTQAIGADDPASQAVWAAHLARMAEHARAARAVEPDLKLASRDPYALRYVALTGLVVALLFGSVWRLGSLSALAPGGATTETAAGPAWEGWLKPPAYTGKPTLYLADQTGDAITLPAGTKLQLRLYGEPGSLIVSETVSGRTEVPAASDPAQELIITRSGSLDIQGEGGRAWQITVTPDAPPTVAADGEVGRKADGRFTQGFKAADDYAVTKGQATLTLDLAQVDRRYGLTAAPDSMTPLVLDLPMPRKGKRTEFTQTLIDDLSKSILSNQPVTLTFSVTDAAGQTSQSAPASLILPGRRFFDPFAASLVELRRDLLWGRANAPHTVQLLRAITHLPEDLEINNRAYLRLRVAMKRLEAEAATLPDAARDEIAEELWQVAILIEDGDLTSAKDRLKRAQDRLDEAIRKGASPEEIQELMDEMRDAMNDYMREMAENMPKDPNDETSRNEDGPTITQDQLQQMMDKLQQLMEEGKTAEAAELAEQLRQMMENMQMVEGDGSGQGQGGPGQQAMRDLGETLRGQQGLSDDAFRDLQDGQEGNGGTEQADPEGEGGEQGQTDGSGGKAGKTLAERQEDLRQRLEQLDQNGRLPGEGTEPGTEGRRKLEDARRAMRDAEDALRDGDLPGALDRQAEAMDALRDGIRDLGEALAQENRREGQGQPGQANGGEDPREGRDPLGRQTGESLHIGSDDNLLQDKDIYRRAEELLGEIRRRSGDLTRPEGERDYLQRLLDLF